VLLVVIEDILNGLDTRIFLVRIGGTRLVLLVPVEDATDKGRDKRDASLSTGNSLAKSKQESEVAVNAFLLELARGLDTFPCGGNFDQNTLLGDANGVVESDKLLCLLLGALLIERKARVNLS
jgi:hypothetical protein